MRIELKEETTSADGTWYYVFKGWTCVKASRDYQVAKEYYDKLKDGTGCVKVLEFFEV